MKLLFITRLYPAFPGDLEVNQGLHFYLREIIKAGHSVEVIKVHSPNILEYLGFRRLNLPKEFVFDGVSVQNKLMLKLPGDFFIYPHFDQDFMERFDGIIGHMPDGLYLSYRLSKYYGIPLILGIHYTDFKRSGLKKGTISKRYRKILTHAELINFRSNFLKESFEKSLPWIAEKGGYMPGGVHSSWLNINGAKRGEAKETMRVLTVANLIRRKNIDLLVDALKSLEELDWSLCICGGGCELDNLKVQVDSLNLQSRISFMGSIDHQQVMKHMDHADVFVLPSVGETFGVVYLEAMARGCSTVGTVNEGIDGVIIHGKNGFLCEPTRESIQHVISTLYNMPANELEKISKNGISTAQNYTYPFLAQGYLKRLSEVLKVN